MNKSFVEGFEKRAVLGMLGKAALGAGGKILGLAKSVGGAVVRNPMKSATVGFVGMDVAGGASAGARATQNAKYLNQTL